MTLLLEIEFLPKATGFKFKYFLLLVEYLNNWTLIIDIQYIDKPHKRFSIVTFNYVKIFIHMLVVSILMDKTGKLKFSNNIYFCIFFVY